MKWLLLLLLLVPAAAQHKKPAHKPKKSTHHSARSTSHASDGMAPERARAIEQALLEKGYLKQVSGRWDAAAAAAMKKFQAEHKWQTRFVPDARALLALGLGPDRDGDRDGGSGG